MVGACSTEGVEKYVQYSDWETSREETTRKS